MKDKYDFQATRIPSLGPFGLRKVPPEMYSLFLISIQYRIWRPCNSLSDLIPGFRVLTQEEKATSTSKISPCPFMPLHLEAIGVSPQAVNWLYLPPMQQALNTPELQSFASTGSPVHLLVLNGGFAFYDPWYNPAYWGWDDP